MKILIVDDEKAARENAKQLLAEFFPGMMICAEAENIESAHQAILLHQPDVILLDVDLPDGNAFDLLKKFTAIHFNIIFITAHEKYALRAIKFSALDFLLKPYTTSEFIDAIQKAQIKLKESEINVRFSTLMQNFQFQNQSAKIVLRTSDSIHVVQTDEIIRLQADGAYTTFYISNRKPIVVSKNLKEYDGLLENNGFIRTHQSHLVNSKFIACYIKADGGSLRLTDASQVPVATRFKEKVLSDISRI